jgi:hypothetical protein
MYPPQDPNATDRRYRRFGVKLLLANMKAVCMIQTCYESEQSSERAQDSLGQCSWGILPRQVHVTNNMRIQFGICLIINTSVMLSLLNWKCRTVLPLCHVSCSHNFLASSQA